MRRSAPCGSRLARGRGRSSSQRDPRRRSACSTATARRVHRRTTSRAYRPASSRRSWRDRSAPSGRIQTGSRPRTRDRFSSAIHGLWRGRSRSSPSRSASEGSSRFGGVPEVSRLAELFRERGPAVVLTGAGISTESGIPDFRSPTGIWARYDPQEYATIDAFRADPGKVWRFYALRFRALTEAEPNAGHLALAELERAGHVRAVVTQNIDLLHERAGSREVVEVHGSIRTSSCLGCGAVYPLAEVAPLVEAGDGPPACAACGAILKPDVVFFDELLPEGALERAQALAEEARLLLVVGSSLEVHPVADLPRATLAA